MHTLYVILFFFFNDTATTEIYTLSLHDALPIYREEPHQPHREVERRRRPDRAAPQRREPVEDLHAGARSEEHTSELQSRPHLVCRLLLEKKKELQRNEAPSLEHEGIRCSPLPIV